MTDNRIDAEILTRTQARGFEKTVCPSEVARALLPEDWRSLMDRVRSRARVLAIAGRIAVCQSGVCIDPERDWSGPIRLRYRGGAED